MWVSKFYTQDAVSRFVSFGVHEKKGKGINNSLDYVVNAVCEQFI